MQDKDIGEKVESGGVGKNGNSCQKPKCFVIMPFNDGEYEQDHFLNVYKYMIKPAAEEEGYEVSRVDEILSSTKIMDKIYSRLKEAEMVICDLSARNSNVFYELGIRHALAKPVVLIKDDRTEFSFDVSGITTILYDSSRKYENVVYVKKRIQEAIRETESNWVDVWTAIGIQLDKESSKGKATSEAVVLQKILLGEMRDLKSEIHDMRSGSRRIQEQSIESKSSFLGKELMSYPGKIIIPDNMTSDNYSTSLIQQPSKNAGKK